MLGGIRVLDLTAHLAGPYCTWILGSLGADVIKIERPGVGDPSRAVGPYVAGESVYFGSINRNKRSLTLNLKHVDGAQILARVIRSADVVVENFRPGVLDRLGFPDEVLTRLNSRLIRASISGFGQTGPMRDRPAFDIVVQAWSGMMSVTGPEGGPSVRVGVSIGDIGAALFATIAILAALVERNAGNSSRRIDVAMLECQLALLENAIARYLNTGESPRPLGTRHPSVAPFQAFKTSDGMVVIAVEGDEHWHRLCGALDVQVLGAQERYTTAEARLANHKELEADLARIFLTRSTQAWLETLAAADVPCGPVHTVPQAIESEQVRARGMILEGGSTGGTRLRYVACPVGDREVAAGRAAPAVGEHTGEILHELGYAPSQVAQWRAQGVV
ncbi:MAG: CaiB/BaiF CoA transferase family protein [Candidatus Methylomirabilia bacterium]